MRRVCILTKILAIKNGTNVVYKTMQEACEKENLPASTIYSHLASGRPLKNGTCFDYIAEPN